MNEWYNGEGDKMNNIYERLNQFLWSHPTYKKVVGFLTIALKYIMMASYREFDSCLQFFTNQIAQNVDYINAFEFFYCQIR